MKRTSNFLIGLIIMLTCACSKTRTDVRVGNLPTYNNLANSTVRVVLGNGYDVKVNGIKLTNWVIPPTGTIPMPYPTPYFPVTGKLGNTWYVPQEFLNANGQATIETITPELAPQPDLVADSFQVQEDYYHPSDYYLAGSYKVGSTSFGVTKVPRAISPAADPTHILVRLVNLSFASVNNGASNNLTLAYANGSPVSAGTSGIAGGKWSDYTELTYGTYQFKVLIDGSYKEIPGLPPMITNVNSFTDYTLLGTKLFYAGIRSFQPGGVYTVVVCGGSGYQSGDLPISTYCFSVITDIAPAANISYGKLQVVNAAAANGLQVQIDGASSTVAYGTAGGYQILPAGSHQVHIMDGSGNTLVQKTVPVNGGDNLSVWVYPTASGASSMTLQNNMSSIRDMQINSDGSDASTAVYDPLNFGMVVSTRFLNLCPELPFVTFTQANGALFADSRFSVSKASQNLPSCQPPDSIALPYPYVDQGIVTGGIVQAYLSQPQIVPGDRLTEVAPLSPANFIQMPAVLYPTGDPGPEAGVYTVALIGHNNATQQPYMIVVKHNQ